MVDPRGNDAVVAQLLGKLGSVCNRGYALAAHIRYTRPTHLYQAYDQAWVDHYSEKGYMLADPTVHWGLAHVGAVDWADLVARDPEGIIAAAERHGLLNGWTYAVGDAASRTIASMTRDVAFDAAQKARCMAIIDEIHARTGA
jgi:LuxR family transcriptional regulator